MQFRLSPSQVDKVIGQNLARARTSRRLTVSVLSERSGLGAETLMSMEAGFVRARPAELFKLGRLLNVPVGAFFETDPVSGGSDEMVS
jgi:XRE family transcriptional regulator, regulator of sulfur utilization